MDTKKPPAWRDWYHITITPYGQWLPGDARGWSERHHRKHVPGHTHIPADFGHYAAGKLKHSKNLLQGPVVAFDPKDFPSVAALILQSLKIQNTPCLAISVKHDHIHFLARCIDSPARIVAGKCKRNVATAFPESADRMWAKRCDDRPIQNRTHGVEVLNYISEHEKEGAWVWSFRSPPPSVPVCTHGA